jgi:hypothetical protein
LDHLGAEVLYPLAFGSLRSQLAQSDRDLLLFGGEMIGYLL